jgi:hypothetical protein
MEIARLTQVGGAGKGKASARSVFRPAGHLGRMIRV